MTRELKAAILLWKRGQQIDTALHATLAAQGYVVAKLERRYYA
ncbi:hypothetical protein [Sinorhizobium meliloti]|nr:hypothetical protein [Sinorhizobium meliloti]